MTTPKLIVFDLDYTLWPFFSDYHVKPPFKQTCSTIIVDSTGKEIIYYPEVPEVLKNLHDRGYTLAVASRTTEIHGAHQLLSLLEWSQYFTYKEIYPGCKVKHFEKFKNYSGLEYSEMLFFDDNYQNIIDLTGIGVTSIEVDMEYGITAKLVQDGIQRFLEDHPK